MSKTLRITLSMMCVLLYVLISFIPTTTLTVDALNISVEGGYTTALEDLSQDENFNPEDYPVNEKDYSLQVIQIAESSEKELFVYVYQPCSPNKDLTATSIKFSSTIGNELNYRVYRLNLLNSVGCFYKYIVKDFVVSSETVRHYDISAIHRLWNENYDDDLPEGNENIISEVPFAVGRYFKLITTESGVDIECQNIDLITVTDKYVGFVRYFGESGGPMVNWKYKDSHFVAFKTDKLIDRLMEADIFFQTQSKHVNHAMLDVGLSFQTSYNFGSIVDKYVNVTYDDKVVYEEGDLFWKHKYTWKRIQTAEDFINSENSSSIFGKVLFNQKNQSVLNSEGLHDIEDMDWVLRFYETDYTESGDVSLQLEPLNIYSTLVSNISILRLAFETDGDYYNLGVVDNFQTGDGNPDGGTLDSANMFKILLMLLLLVILIVILGPILPTIISLILWVFKTVLKIAWWIISLPFKLFRKNKKRY